MRVASSISTSSPSPMSASTGINLHHQGGVMRNKVKRLKVRLVVQGQHMSKEKGDFMNAFAPVPHMSGIKTVVSMMASSCRCCILSAEDWCNLW